RRRPGADGRRAAPPPGGGTAHARGILRAGRAGLRGEDARRACGTAARSADASRPREGADAASSRTRRRAPRPRERRVACGVVRARRRLVVLAQVGPPRHGDPAALVRPPRDAAPDARPPAAATPSAAAREARGKQPVSPVSPLPTRITR